MWATGPKCHTIGMNIKASKKGNHMSSKGLFAKDKEPKLVPTPTKKGVSRILDWIYKPPETRGKNTKESDPF